MDDKPLDFDVPDRVDSLKDEIDEFLATEIQPIEEEYSQFLGEDGHKHRVDEDERLVDEFLAVREDIRALSLENGFYTCYMPERVGGGGLDLLEFCLLLEHLNNRDPEGFHGFIFDTHSVSRVLLPAYEDDFQREKYFEPVMNGEKKVSLAMTEPEHGSGITHMDSVGTKEDDEWVLNAEKCFVSQAPYADFMKVPVRTSGSDGDIRGITTFLVDASNPGLEVGKIQRPMGGFEEGQAYVHLNDCRVPEENVLGEKGRGLLDAALGWVNRGRIHTAATAVGRSQWMFEESVEYAKERKSFGEPIGEKQFIKGMLAEMRIDIEKVRWLYRHAAWSFEQDDRSSRWEQSAAKYAGAQLWNDVADKALQIQGGYGWMRSSPIQGEYREARASRIYDGTDEMQKRTIANQFLRE